MALSSCLGSSHSFLCYLWVRKHLDSIFELQQKWNEKIGSYFSFALVQLVGRGSLQIQLQSASELRFQTTITIFTSCQDFLPLTGWYKI